MNPPASRAARGFTLFELLIVMAVVGILVGIAVPSYRYMINANRIASEVNGLLGDLQFARAEAIKEGQTVTACVSTNGTVCATGSTAWNGGWIVFSDVNGNGSVESGDTLLRVQKTFNSTDTFIANNSVAYVSFNREGFATGNSGFIASGTTISLHAVTPNTSSTRCLAMSLMGLMQVLQYNGSTCT